MISTEEVFMVYGRLHPHESKLLVRFCTSYPLTGVHVNEAIHWGVVLKN